MQNFILYLYFISGITIAALYVPFFVLLNKQDSSYGAIYTGVLLQGKNVKTTMSFFRSNTFFLKKNFLMFMLRFFHFDGDQNI